MRMPFLEPFPPRVSWNTVHEWCCLICVIFATFNFNYCMVMGNSHSCINSVHSTMALFSSSVNTLVGPILQFLVLPFKWLDREVSGIPHYLLVFCREWTFISTTCITYSRAWSIHVDIFVYSGCFFLIWHCVCGVF